jgi:hypothetical protein
VAIEWTTNQQYTAPAAAASVSLTVDTGDWADSDWFTVLASAPADLLITGLNVFAVGAAAAESVITTFAGQYKAAGTHGSGYIPHVIPLDAVPSGSRISARIRKNGTDADPWSVSITYLRKPITGTVTTTTKPQKAAPASDIVTVATPVVAWDNGTWQTVLASAAADIVIVGVAIPALTGSSDWEVDLGVGAAASETVITSVAGRRGGLVDGPCFFPLANPLDIVLSGERVAARIRGAEAAARNTTVKIVYHEKPL